MREDFEIIDLLMKEAAKIAEARKDAEFHIELMDLARVPEEMIMTGIQKLATKYVPVQPNGGEKIMPKITTTHEIHLNEEEAIGLKLVLGNISTTDFQEKFKLSFVQRQAMHEIWKNLPDDEEEDE